MILGTVRRSSNEGDGKLFASTSSSPLDVILDTGRALVRSGAMDFIDVRLTIVMSDSSVDDGKATKAGCTAPSNARYVALRVE
jgi:hypothetical protein